MHWAESWLKPLIKGEFSSKFLISPEFNKIEVEGYIKENYISSNRIGHITGVGDFRIRRIVLPEDPCPVRKAIEKKNKKINDNVDMNPELEHNEILQEYDETTGDQFEVENQVNQID